MGGASLKKKKTCTKTCQPNCSANPKNHIPHEHIMVAVSAFILALVGVIMTNNLAEAAPGPKPVVKIVCSDTDPKIDPAVAGEVTRTQITTLNKRETRKVLQRQSDKCVNPNAVREHYCKKGAIVSKVVPCKGATVCEKGACVAPASSNPTTPETPTVPTTPTPVTPSPTPNPVSTGNTTNQTMPGILIEADGPVLSHQNSVQAILTGTQLGRFRITNLSSSTRINVSQLIITDFGSHTGAPTYRLHYSDANSSNYTGNIAVYDQNTLQFTNLNIPLDGNSSRYVTISVRSTTGMLSGDTFQLGIPTVGDALYSVTETELGYDGNGNGTLLDTINNLIISGKPMLGALVKQ